MKSLKVNVDKENAEIHPQLSSQVKILRTVVIELNLRKQKKEGKTERKRGIL